MSPSPEFDQFRQDALARGFDEVTERHWAPGVVMATHTHPYAVEVRVVQGEMWLGCGDGPARHLLPGATFSLAPQQPHDERYGPDGATYWVARQHPA